MSALPGGSAKGWFARICFRPPGQPEVGTARQTQRRTRLPTALPFNGMTASVAKLAKSAGPLPSARRRIGAPKVKSDVKKIVETDRGYTTAFFITNQSVPAKKRAAVEDELQKQYGIRVSIFDRTWILEKVFAGHAEDLAISELKVTALSKNQVHTGKGDAGPVLRS